MYKKGDHRAFYERSIYILLSKWYNLSNKGEKTRLGRNSMINKRKLLLPSGLIILSGMMWRLRYTLRANKYESQEEDVQQEESQEEEIHEEQSQVEDPQEDESNEDEPNDENPQAEKTQALEPRDIFQQQETQKSIQEKFQDKIKEVRDEFTKERGVKNLNDKEQSLQKVVNNSKSGLMIQLGLSIVLLVFILFMILVGAQTLLPWVMWLIIGVFNIVFGIIFHVVRKL